MRSFEIKLNSHLYACHLAMGSQGTCMLCSMRHPWPFSVQIIWGNFFREDLHNADIIIVYLSQDANMKLSEKLSRELKSGTRIVSHTFTFCCFEEIETGEDSPIYLYKS